MTASELIAYPNQLINNYISKPVNIPQSSDNHTVEGLKIDGKSIGDMTKQEIIDSVPDDWEIGGGNGHINIKDGNGIIRIRIDPADSVGTPYDHIHIYDEIGNPLTISGEIGNPKSPDVHIPLKK